MTWEGDDKEQRNFLHQDRRHILQTGSGEVWPSLEQIFMLGARTGSGWLQRPAG